MKIKIIVICVLLILATISFSGCEKILDDMENLESAGINYINVTIAASADLHLLLDCDGEYEMGVGEVEIKIKMDKASGENKIFYGTTDGYGVTPKYTHSFKVYREQPVNIYASISGDVPEYLKNHSFTSAYEQYDWEYIDARGDFGDTVKIDTTLKIKAVPPECEGY